MKTKRSALGRPPASNSLSTRSRIIDVARRSFAARGYAATTNKTIAEGAGLTTGAIYHYFKSKGDIYLAILVEVEMLISERFIAAEASQTTFIAKVEAVMQAFHELNAEDASIAQFLGAARIDQRRLAGIPELPISFDGDYFYQRLIDGAIQTGEIAPQYREPLRHFFRAVSVGLVDGVSDQQSEHKLAIEGLSLVMNGALANNN